MLRKFWCNLGFIVAFFTFQALFDSKMKGLLLLDETSRQNCLHGCSYSVKGFVLNGTILLYSNRMLQYFRIQTLYCVISVPIGGMNTNIRVNWSGQGESSARQWDCEEVPGVVKGVGGSRDHLVWWSKRHRRALALALGTLDGASADPGLSHYL